MKTSYFDPSFIENLMNGYSQSVIKVKSVELLPVDNSASILVALTAGMSESTIGHFGLMVTYEAGRVECRKKMVMK